MISRPFVHLTILLLTLSTSFALPGYADRMKRQVEDTSSGPGGPISAVDPPPPPGPPSFIGAKLVNDPAHPWMPLRDGDERGPCPGMNTLASHGVGIQLKLAILSR